MTSTADQKSIRTSYLGLGVMGYPMAGHLARNGYQVCVYNRSSEKAAAWSEEHSGTTAPTPAAAAENADVVFACVGNDFDIERVCCGGEWCVFDYETRFGIC